MKTTHILIFEHDILKYPPILSVISFLLSQHKKVVVIGYCSDQQFIDEFIEKDGVFYSVIENKTNDSITNKLKKYFFFKKRVSRILESFSSDDSKIWLFGEQCVWLLHKSVYQYDVNVYLFEVPSFSVTLKYKILSPSLNYRKALQTASKVICCEYNRAHITKSFFQLNDLPTIVPNKPNYESIVIDDSIGEYYLSKYMGKKIILYQGIFNYPERKLEGFCEAIDLLPNDYVLVLMGGDNLYKQQLKDKYESDRIVFIPHISAPNHLSITKRAHIGILVYNGIGGQIEHTLNTLYCAPNKVYEYAKFGIPMVANDVPALNYIFEKYKCGSTFRNYDKYDIIDVIKSVDLDYVKFQEQSSCLYDDVDVYKIYQTLV